MRWVSNLIAWIADFTGTLAFIIIYNVSTIVWVWLGAEFTWFPDRWPYNGYTGLVSWLAINTASFILFRDRRREKKEKSQEERDSANLEATKMMVEAWQEYMPLLRQVAQNQVVILGWIQEQEEVREHGRR